MSGVKTPVMQIKKRQRKEKKRKKRKKEGYSALVSLGHKKRKIVPSYRRELAVIMFAVVECLRNKVINRPNNSISNAMIVVKKKKKKETVY